jgi:NitT/TauT family transport system substrate-binding protein
VPLVVAALKTASIDALAIVPNIAETLTRDRSVVEIRKIADYISNYEATAVVTSTAKVAKRREPVQRYLAAYSQGVADYNAALVDKTIDKGDTAAIVGLIHK